MIEDRGVKKIRVNMLKDGKLTGFLRPIYSFSKEEGAGEPGGPKPINFLKKVPDPSSDFFLI